MPCLAIQRKKVQVRIDSLKPHCSAGILHSQSGQSMAEFLVILPVMLLLIFGTIQFALIFHAKITLNYAAFEGVRAGTLNNGKFDAVKEGFARGLAPLYSYYEPDESKRDDGDPANQVGAFQVARDKVYDEFESPDHLIRIERLNPTNLSFADYAPDGVIPNDNLRYRSSQIEGGSKTSVQDANLLHLRFTYWYPLYVPFVNRLIFDRFICCKQKKDIFDDSIWGGKESGSTFSCKWAGHEVCIGDEPRIPLTATAVMRMQSPVEKSDGYYSQN